VGPMLASGDTCGEGRWALGIAGAALLKAVWWDLCLASLLTHLFFPVGWYQSVFEFMSTVSMVICVPLWMCVD